MSHTFDIRFAHSQGLAAVLEAPANIFLWKGAGRLSIDAEGINFAVKRGLANILSRRRSHHISVGELTEVYREGEALRFGFGAHPDRQVLPLWANDTEAAARIVKLLPTTHTVELEHPTQSPRRFHLDKRMAILLLCLLGIAAVALTLVRNFAQVAGESQNAPVTTLPAATAAPADPLVESVPVELDIARRQQNLFESELKNLRAEYFSLVGSGDAQALERLEPRWWAVRFRIEASEPMSGPAFTGYREGQLAIVSSWSAAVSLHAAGLRLRDERLIQLAEKQRDLAEKQEQIIRKYVR
jgi:hypothetical protein